MNLGAMLNQTMTYWSPGESDGFGSFSFAGVTPRQVSCRWQDTQVKFTTKDGVEHVSQSVIYAAEELEIGGYVVLGDAGTVTGTDPHGSGAVEIRHLGASPSLHASQTLYKYFIMGSGNG